MIAAFIICLILICITSFLHLVSEEVCRAYRRRIGHLLSLVYHKSIFAFKYHFVRGDENRGFESLRIKKRPIRDRSFLNWGGRIRTSEMAGPKPAALPLGDAPSRLYSIYHILSMLNVKSY